MTTLPLPREATGRGALASRKSVLTEWYRRLFAADLPASRKWVHILLLALLVIACAVRVWMIVRYNPIESLTSDPGRHWGLGTRPLDTQPFAAIDPIGYHVYLGVLAKLTVHSPVLVAYWTALLSLAAPWLWYRFLRELIRDRTWALTGWVLLAALPSWSIIYSFFMQETLMLPLLGAALWATWRCRRKRSTASFVIAAGVWLLAGLTRGICIPLAAVAMTWLWFEQGHKLEKAVISVALLAGILGPLAGRSWSIARLPSPHGIGTLAQLYQQAGTSHLEFEFSRRGGTERWYYEFTSPAVMHPPFAPFSEWRSRREGTVRFSIDLDHGTRDWNAARARLPDWDLRRAAWLTGESLVLLFFSHSWPDTDFARPEGVLNFWLRWIWAPLALGCAVVTIVTWRRQRERLLPTLLLTWFVVQGLLPIAVGEGRYRKPFEGLLIAQCLLLASTIGSKRNNPPRQ
jgi:hypothetical protein